MTPSANAAAFVIGAESTIGGAITTWLEARGQTVHRSSRRDLKPHSKPRSKSPSKTGELSDEGGDGEEGGADNAARVAETVHIDLAGPGPYALPDALQPGDVAYFCAGITSLQACRDAPRLAFRVNVEHTVTLAQQLWARGIAVVFLSSDQVFDGTQPKPTQSTPPQPGSVYGQLKHDAEQRLLDRAPSQEDFHGDAAPLLIARLTKVLRPGRQHHPLFVQWAEALQRGEAIHPFSDRAVAPLPLEYVAKTVASLADAGAFAGNETPGNDASDPPALRDSNASPIVHVSAASSVTYAAIATRLAEVLGVDASLIHPITAKERGVECFGPHVVLDAPRLHNGDIAPPPDVWTTIEAALRAD